MGIYLYFQVDPAKIDPDRWERGFQDAVRISRAARLARRKENEYDGYRYDTAVAAEPDDTGIRIQGDLVTGINMEPQCFPRRLEPLSAEHADADLLTLHLGPEKAAEYGLARPEEYPILGNKTQGERGHIYVLAMALVFCDAFPDATYIDGDLTAGQVKRAVEIAEEILGRKLRPPVEYDLERLLPRVRAMARDDEVVETKLLLAIYKGLRTEAFRGFVTTRIPADTLYAALRDMTDNDAPGEILRRCLEAGLPFRDAARLLLADPKGKRMAATDFAEEVLRAGLHIPDKPLYDVTRFDNGREEVASMDALLSTLLGTMAGLRSPVIDRYVSLPEIKSCCAEFFENVDEVFARAEQRLGGDASFQAVKAFYDTVHELSRLDDAAHDTYDIREIDELFDWQGPRQTIAPDILRALCEFAQKVKEVTEESWHEFLERNAEERRRLLVINAGRKMILPDTVMREMLDRVMDDIFIERYMRLLSINLNTPYTAKKARLFFYNRGLLDYIWSQTDGGSHLPS